MESCELTHALPAHFGFIAQTAHNFAYSFQRTGISFVPYLYLPVCRVDLYVPNPLYFSSQVLDGICARGAVCTVDIQYCSFITHTYNVRIELHGGNCGFLPVWAADI